MGQLSTVDRAFRRLKPRARSADRESATVDARRPCRPYLPRDVVDGQVEVGAEHLEGEALGLTSAAFLRGWGRVVSVPTLESGRVARRGECRARRGARLPNRRKAFPARVAVFSRLLKKRTGGTPAHAPKRLGRSRFEALEHVGCRIRT